ncbi:hypothetical protein LUZ60_008871 [Juncus effusus]|nr:hypothetical protein LUZ60_008871 [Juncus effusus]
MSPSTPNSTIVAGLYPSEDDLPYEEEVLRAPLNLKNWWHYLIASSAAPFEKRQIIYERALRALPGSFKLWEAYLRERTDSVRHLAVSHSSYEYLNNTFERALITMHRMPRIWTMYLASLTDQRLITRSRRTFDRALRALPVTQHNRIWSSYLKLVSLPGVPVETSLRVYRRYLCFDPLHVEDFIEFLIRSERWQEAADQLASALNDDSFYSVKGKTKHQLWLELCNLLTKHATEISGIKVDAIIRGGIRKFTDAVGRLWTSLGEYYVRRGLYEKARDVFEEGMSTVVTARDFSVIFDAYVQFEQSVLAVKLEAGEETGKKFLEGCWLNDDDDTDLRLARIEKLLDRRAELLNSVLLRQNPHDVEQWHRRVKLFERDLARQASTYVEAVKTVDPAKAVGKPHTLWVGFAKLYEAYNQLESAREVFSKATQAGYSSSDHLAGVWCEWAEMELRCNNFKKAVELMRRATAETKLHKSLRLWSFYADLEESLGTLESARAVYERILDLRIATPQIILNYAFLLEENKYFEDAFRVYERGVRMFKYPHVRDIWVTYLSKFVERYGKSKLERARELFEEAVRQAPAREVKPLFLQYAKLEEDCGLEQEMVVYERAVKAVEDSEKLSVYQICIARAAEISDLSKVRQIYEQVIQSGLPDKDVYSMCLKYAEMEWKLGEIDRVRKIFTFASNYCDPGSQMEWIDFEMHHGNEDTFREMLRINCSIKPSFFTQVNKLEKEQNVNNNNNNKEEIELLPDDDGEEGEDIGVAQKTVPDAVFGELVKRKERETKEEDVGKLVGALQRIKRQRKQ